MKLILKTILLTLVASLAFAGQSNNSHTSPDMPSSTPNGWVKVLGADGSVGENLEGSQEY